MASVRDASDEMNRVFDDFGEGFWRHPMRSLAAFERAWPRQFAAAPVVDVAETDNAYEITAELPGMDEKNISVYLANGGITIKSEKKQETEEKKKDYYISERRYGSFERFFDLPEGVDADKIAATGGSPSFGKVIVYFAVLRAEELETSHPPRFARHPLPQGRGSKALVLRLVHQSFWIIEIAPARSRNQRRGSSPRT